MTDPRNWDKELDKIDKLMTADRTGAPSSVPARTAGAPGQSAPAPRASAGAGAVATRPRDTIGIWLRALLGLLGAAALAYWPYNKACGTTLYTYLAGVSAIIGMGVYTMRHSWTHRRGIAHMVGLLVLFAGLALAAAEILPRIGYAATALTWTCP